tara:strand:+ start:119 stop:613 length:495 start_codon:yes stop_codon:yes gene_type:complete
MALQRISPGLTPSTKVTTKKKFYSDIDLSFTPKTGSPDENGVYTGDIYKKLDIRAVEQAVQNILMTNTLEKPFEPTFGANISAMLFDMHLNFSESVLTTRIETEIKRWEPRAHVEKVQYYVGDQLIEQGISNFGERVLNTVRIIVELTINNNGFTTTINLNRFR